MNEVCCATRRLLRMQASKLSLGLTPVWTDWALRLELNPVASASRERLKLFFLPSEARESSPITFLHFWTLATRITPSLFDLWQCVLTKGCAHHLVCKRCADLRKFLLELKDGGIPASVIYTLRNLF